MKKLTFLLLLSALAVSTACGGDDDDAATDAGADTDAGAVIVESDTDEVPEVMTAGLESCPLDAFMVEAVTGVELVESFDVIETGDGVACTFSAISGEVGIGVTVYGTTGAAAMETLATITGDAEAVDLRFADDAIWSPGMTTLHAVKGDRGTQVQISDFGAAIGDPLQVASELAEIALD